MLMQLVFALDARVVASMPAKTKHQRRMLFVRRQSIEEAVSINNSCSKLPVTHELSELLAPRLILS